MKKHLSVFIAILLITTLLFGCGAKDSFSKDSKSNESASDSSAPRAPGSTESSGESSIGGGTSVIAGAGTDSSLSEKIIYTAWADIETTEFDDSIKSVYSLLEKYRAFIQSSSITGSSYSDEYYGRQSYRYAEFTLRVPRENYAALTSALSNVGNVLSLNSSIDNITSQYTDTESQLKTYRIEEERLLSMLEKADTVEDMISIESRLSEIRYKIESLTSTLRDWDNQVNYSTVTLNINEVKKLTEQVSLQRSYWEEMGDGVVSTLKSIGTFFKDLFMFLAVSMPVLIILAAIAVTIILIIRKGAKNARIKNRTISSEVQDDTEK